MGRRRHRSDRRPTTHSLRRLLGSHRQLRLEPLEERRLLAITVTTHEDIVDANDDVTSLREAIEAANATLGADVIDFDFGHDGPETIVLTQGQLTITDSLTIQGSGASLLTFDASGSDPTPDENNGDGSRVFNIDDGNNANVLVVSLHGVTIRGGDVTGDGGGFLSLEDTSLVDAVVAGNHATGSGGIRQLRGALSLLRSQVLSNSGNQGGGILVQLATLDIQDSTISQNIGQGSGGGISARSGSIVSIARSTISHNTDVVGGAGGIWVDGVELTIVDSAIDDNTAGGRGGGMEVLGNSKFTMIDSSVSRNHAAGGVTNASAPTLGGGGLFVNFANVSAANSEWLIRGSTIADNQADFDGGGIYVVNSNTIQGYGTPNRPARLKIEESYITGNIAGRDGGGLFAFDVELVVEDSVIADNSALGTIPIDVFGAGRGGGLFASQTSNVSVRRTVVRDNTARLEGGGLGASPAALVLSSGARLPANLTVRDSLVEGNTAGEGGGGVYLDSGKHSLLNVTISANKSGGDGGGIYAVRVSGVQEGSHLQLQQVTISENRAEGSGGGVFIGGNATVGHSTIVGNVADSDGNGMGTVGGIAVGQLFMDHTIVANNRRGGEASDISGGFLDADFNLIETVSPGLILNGTGNITGEDPRLGPLADNGGPALLDGSKLRTHAILSGSPAIDAGDPSGGQPALASAYRADVMISMPSRYYRFEEPGGTAAGDELTTILGQYSGNPMVGVDGAIPGGKAVQFDGVNDYLTIGSSSAPTAGGFSFGHQFTVEIWGRSATESWNASGWLFSARSNNGVVIHPIAGTKAWSMLLVDSSGVVHEVGTFVPDAAIDIRDWHHYAVSWDGATGTAKMYFDGVAVASQTLNIERSASSLFIPVLVGRNQGAGSQFGQGAVDELVYYQRIVSGEELAERASFAQVTNYDQRGEPHLRVLDGDGAGGARIDMGAYERALGETYTFVVDTLADESDGDFSAGDFSLREAIELANANPGADAIEFDPALWAAGPATILLTQGELQISDSLTIEGPGADLLSIDASGNDPTPESSWNDGNSANDGDGSSVFYISDDTAALRDVELRGLRITGGDSASAGGGIVTHENLIVDKCFVTENSSKSPLSDINGGGGILSLIDPSTPAFGAFNSLTVRDSIISNNTAFNGEGGGIRKSAGALTVERTVLANNRSGAAGGGISAADLSIQVQIRDSLIRGNRSGTQLTGPFRGGAIFLFDAVARIENSSVIENRAPYGAAIYVQDFSQTTGAQGVETSIRNSTISGNIADSSTGGIYAAGLVKISHSTIFGNTRGDIRTGNSVHAEVRLYSSIVANNVAGNISVNVFSDGYNLLSSGKIVATDVANVGTNSIAPLNYNGGPVFADGSRMLSHALLPGSPAINAGDPLAESGVNGVPEFDQRGGPWTRVAGGRIDMGAVESQANPLPGDYNFNGVVDAADYSVWRDTVGSTNDLRADGSSATTPGVSDSVVDEHDYAWWKANFGKVLQTGGSGSGYLAGELRFAGVEENGGGAAAADFALLAHESTQQAGPARRSSPAVDGEHGGRLVGVDAALVAWVARRGSSAQKDWCGASGSSAVDELASEPADCAALDRMFAALDDGWCHELPPAD